MTIERTTVHVSDDAGRIAMLEKRTIGTDDSPPTLTRYVYSNHLQSASLELDEEANIISYEEYHPYGTTAFQAKNASINAVAKRYRYTGKERDEESGLYYHGARYYIPWLCRWTAIDPMENEYAGISPYNYGNCNPITFNDPSGMSGEDTVKISEQGKSQLIETAKNTSQYKDAIKREDKIILEQYFHISREVVQSQQELNKGKEGANVFYISQSGWVDINGEPAYPSGHFEMSFSSTAKFSMPAVETTTQEQEPTILPELTIEANRRQTQGNIPIVPTTAPVPRQTPPPRRPAQRRTPPPTPPLRVARSMSLNSSQVPSWVTSYNRMSAEMFVTTNNIARSYRRTDAATLNITISIPNNVLSNTQVDSAGSLGFSRLHNRHVIERFTADYYREVGPGTRANPGINNTRTHRANVLSQVNDFQNVLRALLPGIRINFTVDTTSNSSRITINPIRRNGRN